MRPQRWPTSLVAQRSTPVVGVGALADVFGADVDLILGFSRHFFRPIWFPFQNGRRSWVGNVIHPFEWRVLHGRGVAVSLAAVRHLGQFPVFREKCTYAATTVFQITS